MTALLVASTGGHLAELLELRPVLPLDEPVRWVTFDGAQSRGRLTPDEVDFVHYTAPRDAANVLRNVPAAIRLIRRYRPADVVSTGSAVALSFLPAARALGARAHYIESSTRIGSPSLTGKLLERVPGIRLYTQHASWHDRRWQFGGSIWDNFEPGPSRRSGGIARVVVTVGTLHYGFARLIHRVASLLGPEVEVFWQTGATDVTGLSIDARVSVPPRELAAAITDADVVVAHAGVGSAIDALNAGHCPVLVPREQSAGEHVDDHQQLTADELARRGIALCVRADDIDLAVLETAASRTVRRRRSPPSFDLVH